MISIGIWPICGDKYKKSTSLGPREMDSQQGTVHSIQSKEIKDRQSRK